MSEQTVWETRFFRWVWRFNALALAGVLVVGGLIALFALYHIVQDVTARRAVGNIVDPAPEISSGFSEQLGPLTKLGSTGLLWTAVRRQSEARLAYASKQVSAVIDYRIYDPATGESRLLLDRRPSLIMEARMLPGPNSLVSEPRPDVALLVRFVEKDTDGDGRLTANDEAALALARPTGEGLVVLAEGAQVLGVETVSDTLAIATLREESEGMARIVALHLDLAARAAGRRSVLEEKPLP